MDWPNRGELPYCPDHAGRAAGILWALGIPTRPRLLPAVLAERLDEYGLPAPGPEEPA